ncbi:unnamed protein product, partial [Ectocarpus sp. 12 AP-2014]
VPDDIPYYTQTQLESSTTYILSADLSGNLLTDWPDQREEGATAPPLTSSMTDGSMGVGNNTSSDSYGSSDG